MRQTEHVQVPLAHLGVIFGDDFRVSVDPVESLRMRLAVREAATQPSNARLRGMGTLYVD